MAIVTRGLGATAKGSPLTNDELDGNFLDLDARVSTLDAGLQIGVDRLNYLEAIAPSALDGAANAVWNFDSVGTSGWVPTGGTLVSNTQGVRLTATAADSYMTSPVVSITGGLYTQVRAKITRIAGAVTDWDGRLFWVNGTHGMSASVGQNLGVANPNLAVGDSAVISFDLSQTADWLSGVTTQIRLDLGSTVGSSFDVDWVIVGRVAPSASYGDVDALKNQMNSIFGGGSNLLPFDYTQFTANLPAMNTQSGVTVSTEADTTTFGGYWLKAVTSTSAVGWFRLAPNNLDYQMTLKPGGQYVFSMVAKASTARSMSLQLSYKKASDSSVVEVSMGTFGVTTTASRFTVPFTMPAAGNGQAQILFYSSTIATTGTVWVDQIMIEEQVGPVASASTFTPGYTTARNIEPATRNTPLLGLVASSAISLLATDTVLAAFGKIQAWLASLGTAAFATLTTSLSDGTIGRVVKVADFGVGGNAVPLPTDTLNQVLPSGAYRCQATTAGTPPQVASGAGDLVEIQSWDANAHYQRYRSYSTFREFWRVVKGTGNFATTSWNETLNDAAPDQGRRNLSVPGKNFIHNHNGSINNRGTSGAVTGTQGGWVCDRWKVTNGGAGGSITPTRIAGNNLSGIGVNWMRVTCTGVVTNLSGTAYIGGFQQAFENIQIQELAGKAVTISFTFLASVSGKYHISLRNSAGTLSFVQAFTAVAGVSQRVEITTLPIPFDFAKDTNTGLNLMIGSLSNGNFACTAGQLGTWASGNFIQGPSGSGAAWCGTVNAYIQMTEVKLELGTAATKFEPAPFDVELLTCLRYYENFRDTVSANEPNYFNRHWQVTKRVTPTVTVVSGSTAGRTIEVPENTTFRLTGTVNGNADFVVAADADF